MGRVTHQAHETLNVPALDAKYMTDTMTQASHSLQLWPREFSKGKNQTNAFSLNINLELHPTISNLHWNLNLFNR